jgi:hypothetical protein
MTVQQALQQSTNLVFVRLMRDVVRYYMFQLPGSSAALLADADDPRRAEYLARFADREGATFLARFWNKYRARRAGNRSAADAGRAPARLETGRRAPHHRPERDAAGVQRLHRRQPAVRERSRGGTHRARCTTSTRRPTCRWPTAATSPRSIRSNCGWSATCAPIRKPAGAKRSRPAVKERQEVYSWLFKTNRKHAQDKRIAGLLEVESFLKIHAQWKKMGYPFDSLVPSYATTLGASADRPIALAEMMGIIVNGGVRKPVERIDSLHFAKGTPYETLVKRAPTSRERSRCWRRKWRAPWPTPSAAWSRKAPPSASRRPSPSSDGSVIAVGGKTGTGDQRFDVYGARRAPDRVALREPLGDLRLQHRRALLRFDDGLCARPAVGKLRLHQRAAGAAAGDPGAEA